VILENQKMKKIILLSLLFLSFSSYAAYNHDTRNYTLENEIIFKVVNSSQPKLIGAKSYCKDYGSSETLPKRAKNLAFQHADLCMSTIQFLGKYLSMLETYCDIETNKDFVATFTGLKAISTLCENMGVLKRAKEGLSKMEGYSSIVVSQRKINREQAQNKQIELAKQKEEKQKKLKLEKDNRCTNDFKSIVKQDEKSIDSYEGYITELEKTVQEENWRYVRSLISRIDKPLLLITKANDYCFKFPSFPQHEKDSNNQISLLNDRLKIAIEKNKENRKIAIEKVKDSKNKAPNDPKSNKQQEKSSINRSSSGVKYLQDESLFCLSESNYDDQIDSLSEGVMEFSYGCFSSNGRQQVKLIDFSWSGTCAVKRFSDNRKLWVNCESVN
jgi:hypothetical protein